MCVREASRGLGRRVPSDDFLTSRMAGRYSSHANWLPGASGINKSAAGKGYDTARTLCAQGTFSAGLESRR